MKKVFVVMTTLALLGMGVAAQASTWDLSADWSNTQNPMGAWSLWKSPTEMFTTNVPSWSSNGLPTWDDGTHVPVWFRLPNGDIQMHGAEYDMSGTNQTSVVFTCPYSGPVTVIGAIWDVTNNRRSMSWELRKNGGVLSGGTIITDNTYTRSSPFYLAMGWGGAAVLSQNLSAGDRIELAFISNSQSVRLGDQLGLSLEVQSVPEPSGLLALLTDAAGLCGFSFRRRK